MPLLGQAEVERKENREGSLITTHLWVPFLLLEITGRTKATLFSVDTGKKRKWQP